MSILSFEFLKSTLSGEDKAKLDSYLNSPLYYMITGRRGAYVYRGEHSLFVLCDHPHIEDRKIIFPELGKADYELTASFLNTEKPPKNGFQLARYTEEDLKALRKRLAEITYSPVSGIVLTEETALDWRYPVRILDTETVSKMEGGNFKTLRKRFKKHNGDIECVPLNAENGLRYMRAALKFWEGAMIMDEKDTPDMSDFYHEYFKIVEQNPEQTKGLLFKQGHRPLGFCAWDQTQQDTANSFINVGDFKNVNGLSDYQTVILCIKLLENGIRRLNLGGSELQSLDSFKAKFKPVATLPLLSADVIYAQPMQVNAEVFTIVEPQPRAQAA